MYLLAYEFAAYTAGLARTAMTSRANAFGEAMIVGRASHSGGTVTLASSSWLFPLYVVANSSAAPLFAIAVAQFASVKRLDALFGAWRQTHSTQSTTLPRP